MDIGGVKIMLNAHGSHILVDYTGFFPNIENLGDVILSMMEDAIDNSDARRVHSHVENFDGIISPPGFAAVVLLDESHFSAHCYSEKGWLAIDCFTCGDTDAASIIDGIHLQLVELHSSIKLQKRSTKERFLHEVE
jgi:S-adenosylmethionine decarboxylase